MNLLSRFFYCRERPPGRLLDANANEVGGSEQPEKALT